MMNKLVFRILGIFLLIGSISIKAQDITFIPHDTLIIGTLGTEMVFDIDVTNISPQNQRVYMVRTLNDLPPDWTSSLCFESCVHPSVDSLASLNTFAPNESRIISVHVFAANNPGIAHVQIKGGTFRSPNVTYTVNLTAIVYPTSVEDDAPSANDFSLSQNYPNPFNPSTKIIFTVPTLTPSLSQRERVILSVFDMLGREVASLVSEEKGPGIYEVEFNPASSIQHLASGIFFYRLQIGNNIQTRKMILEK